jgi:hypothetical protein
MATSSMLSWRQLIPLEGKLSVAVQFEAVVSCLSYGAFLLGSADWSSSVKLWKTTFLPKP